MNWRRPRQRPQVKSAEEVRAMVDAQMAEFYGVTPETAAEARKLWADHDQTEDRYDFGQYMTWLALQMIQELGPSLTGDELLEKYRHYMGGKP